MHHRVLTLALIALLIASAAAGEVKVRIKHRQRSRQRPAGGLIQGGSRHHRLHRCRGTRLRWCGAYYHQKPLEMKVAPAFGKECPGKCSNVGVCNALTGGCDCPAGWAGKDCSNEQKRPCSAGGSEYAGPGTMPKSHIGPDKRDLNWTAEGWTASRCGGICDDDRAVCFCDDLLNGRVPAAPGSPPGTAPLRQGRPLPDHCQPAQTKDGHNISWGHIPYEKLYGKSGWCTVPVGVEPAHRCGCDVDGTDGGWCELATEQFCVNSCSGHGVCQFGFCKCDAGWFGHDCAGRLEGQEPDKSVESNKGLTARPWLKTGALVPPAGTVQPEPGATRRRPFIFVYDVPAYAAARMLQYRGPKTSCVWRYFNGHNTSVINGGWTYPLETLLHEMLLQSSHRTLDPEEADFFFVPSYTSCFMWPVHGWADYPWWYKDGGPRVMHMANMLLELKQHIQQTYPYWNRTEGRDHIWLATHDEGACWFPKEVYDNSIILTHWGRLDEDHQSNTAYPPDNYTTTGYIDPGNKHLKGQPWTEIIKGHRCYTPGKDLVIPLPKFPAHYRWSPLMGAPAQKRTTLLYFRGDVGKHRLPNYSRGIRQQLYKLTVARNWTGEFNIRIGDRADVPGEYSLGLASSKFCLVAPGDGWSPRAEDAILHGCIPVVIMDEVHAPLESIIDWDIFSVRVQESQLVYLPHILLAISPDRLARMQANLRKVWHRFAYLSQPIINFHAQEVKAHWKREQQSPTANLGQPDEWDTQLEALDEEWQEAQEAMHDRQGFYTAAAAAAEGQAAAAAAAAAAGEGQAAAAAVASPAAAGKDDASSEGDGPKEGEEVQGVRAPPAEEEQQAATTADGELAAVPESSSDAATQTANEPASPAASPPAAAEEAAAEEAAAEAAAAKAEEQAPAAAAKPTRGSIAPAASNKQGVKDGKAAKNSKNLGGAGKADDEKTSKKETDTKASHKETDNSEPDAAAPDAAAAAAAAAGEQKAAAADEGAAAAAASAEDGSGSTKPVSGRGKSADGDNAAAGRGSSSDVTGKKQPAKRRPRQLQQATGKNADGEDADADADADEPAAAADEPQKQAERQQGQQPQASSFKNWTFTDEHVEDDAFGTLMQWLYAKLLRRYNVPLHLVESQQHYLPETSNRD